MTLTVLLGQEAVSLLLLTTLIVVLLLVSTVTTIVYLNVAVLYSLAAYRGGGFSNGQFRFKGPN